MFRASNAHLQEDIVVYKQHMVPSLSIRVVVACRYAASCVSTSSGQIQSIVLVHSLSAHYGIPYCLQFCTHLDAAILILRRGYPDS